MLPVVWTGRALDDLDDIVAFIGTRDVAAAERLQERIEQAVEGLADHPYMFRPGRVATTRELVAHPNYIVVYRVTSKMIQVTAVLHARRRYP